MMFKIILTSTSFQNGGLIPTKYTCDGEDLSPALTWKSVPGNTNSLALIADDPDAGGGTWTHWLIYDIPPDIHDLQEQIPQIGNVLAGAKQGKNDFKTFGYSGPCPPSGTHRYFFTLYALDIELHLPPGVTREILEKAMHNHIIAQGQIMARYHR
jgi:Raf kinase inhibitor-like YbhB/YbcL family protein